MYKKRFGKKNKKGFFLAEETMKIILAVICLGFLIFVLVKMYYSYSGDASQQAEDTLKRIETEINSMKEGDSREVSVYSPLGWTVGGFSDDKTPGNVALCLEKSYEKKDGSCLCVCKKNFFQKEKPCEGNGVCSFFPNKKFSSGVIIIENPPVVISITKNSNMISFSRKN